MSRTVRNGPFDYRVADDDPLPRDLAWWAVLRTRAVDELTGEPPRNALTVATSTPGCRPRAREDGVCGLVARPRDISWPLLAQGRLDAEIRAEGYLPRSLTAAIDASRRTTPMTLAGATQLTVFPGEAAPRTQFVPGRGVVLETPVANVPHSFMITDDPISPPTANVVPLADVVVDLRPGPGPWRVAGVPIVLPDQPLHRARPTVLRGRVLRQPNANTAPVGAPLAQLGITGAWWTGAEVPANSSPPHPVDFVAITAPLAFDHPAATLERITTTTHDGIARSLVSDAAAGASEIELSDVTSLTPGGGDTIVLEVANAAEREIVITASYTPPVGATSARVRLATPLAFPHAAHTQALNVALAFTPLGTLGREAQRGDRVLFASTLAGVAEGDVLRIAGGGATAELRLTRVFPTYDVGANTFADPVAIATDGSFTLPPIARVAQLQLFVRHAGQAVHPAIDVVPDYHGDTPLQILFKP